MVVIKEYFVSYEVREEDGNCLLGLGYSTFAVEGSAIDGIRKGLDNLRIKSEQDYGLPIVIYVVVLTKL